MAISTIAAVKANLDAKFGQTSQIQITADEMVDIIDTLQSVTTAEILEPAALPLNIPFHYPGVPADDAVVLAFASPGSLVLPEDLAGSSFTLGTQAAAENVFTIKVDGTSKGTVTFAIAGTTGTIVFAAEVTLAAGEVLTIENQADNDATAADLMGFIAGAFTPA